MRANDQSHWNKVYSRNSDDQLGWFQEYPAESMQLINEYAWNAEIGIIDIGAGNSRLALELLRAGYLDVSILDFSEEAIARSREILGPLQSRVKMFHSGVLDFRPERVYDIWHDRSVFHFIHAQEEIEAYVGVLHKCLSPSGLFILGGFAAKGPETCSALPVNRLDEERVSQCFGSKFTILETFEVDHLTPSGKVQRYAFYVLGRI